MSTPGMPSPKVVFSLGEDATWPLIEKFFADPTHALEWLQIGPYNKFISTLPGLIESYGTAKSDDATRVVRFRNVKILGPTWGKDAGDLWPIESLNNNLSFLADIFVDVEYVYGADGETTTYPSQRLAQLPVMTGSCLCPTSTASKTEHLARGEAYPYRGGFFQIKTPKKDDAVVQKKMVTIHEMGLPNSVVFFNKKPASGNIKFIFRGEITSHASGARQFRTTIGFDDDERLAVMFPFTEKTTIPLVTVFRALGVVEDDEIFRLVLGADFRTDPDVDLMVTALEYAYECDSKAEALAFIGRKRRGLGAGAGQTEEASPEEEEFYDEAFFDAVELEEVPEENGDTTLALKFLANEFLPHLGEGDHFLMKKAVYLGIVVKEIIKTYRRRRPIPRRDHYANKRCLDVGARLTHQMMQALKGYAIEVSKGLSVKHGQINVLKWISANKITSQMASALTSNGWLFNVTNSQSSKGLSQEMDDFSYIALITNLRRFIIPVKDDASKIQEPREVQGSHAFMMCPHETPEGKKGGLQKPSAITAQLTLGVDPLPVKRLVSKLMASLEEGSTTFEVPEGPRGSPVYVCGDLMGFLEDPEELERKLRELRRRGAIDRHISIAYHPETDKLQIFCEAGRLVRPLLVVEKGELKLSAKDLAPEVPWKDLLMKGKVEYVDPSEEEELLIAFYPHEVTLAHTHCELNPSMMFGVGVTNIPFANHNQGPRNSYQAAMSKQNISVPTPNYHRLFYKDRHVMRYNQTPLSTTRGAEVTGFNTLPSGMNVQLLVLADAFNEEDSLEVSQRAIDMGLFTSSFIETHTSKERTDKGEEFGLVEGDESTSRLTPLGYLPPGEVVNKGDVLIAKYVNQNGERVASGLVTYSEDLPGIVDGVLLGGFAPEEIESLPDMVESSPGGDGYRFVSVRVSQTRVPVRGDKFAARHGQKGVIGGILPAEDMPFSEFGEIPDLIINAHAFPSRMTIAMIKEGVFNKIMTTAGGRKRSGTFKGARALSTIEEVDEDPEDLVSQEFRDLFTFGEHQERVDATAFRTYEYIAMAERELARLGIPHAQTTFYSPATGEPLATKCFFAPVFYQRLKHHAHAKKHARGRGAVNRTRQPTGGKKAGGGYKTGVMEVDCINSQGAAFFTNDRMCKSSDEWESYTCRSCGWYGYLVRGERVAVCQLCEGTEFAIVKVPFGAKFLAEELRAFNVSINVVPIS